MKKESGYTKTILKGYEVGELAELAVNEGLKVPLKSKKTTILRLLYGHFGIENNASIQEREIRLVKAYFDAFNQAIAKADKDIESILAIILRQPDLSLKIKYTTQVSEKQKMDFVKKLCDHCQKHGKEIKDYKPDYYARHFLFGELSRLEQNAYANRISNPLFEGLHDILASWILSARLERILEGTYSPNPGSSGQNKEEFLIFRVYFTKKHEFTDQLWRIVQSCLMSIDPKHTIVKPNNKQKFVDVCNRIRLSCQQHINNEISSKMFRNVHAGYKQPQRSNEKNALYVIYEDNSSSEPLQWECQMKEATIELLRDQLTLLQRKIDERENSDNSKDISMAENLIDTFNNNSSNDDSCNNDSSTYSDDFPSYFNQNSPSQAWNQYDSHHSSDMDIDHCSTVSSFSLGTYDSSW